VPEKQRLDVAMVERGLTDSRTKAQALVMARRVRVDGAIAAKAGTAVGADQAIEIVALEHPWFGRGGMKLDRALEHFAIDVSDLVCADVGASTGGFTDVLLTRGARRVYAIDVGYGQLDQKLREDERVVVMERTNARYLEPDQFDDAIDFTAIDVSFISLEMIVPAVLRIAAPSTGLVALIKPQFEAGRANVGKGGIVRDEAVRQSVVEKIVDFTRGLGLSVEGVIESPVRGAEGNVEYLMHARRAGGSS
jgi:23S rRNA (cytidine1920-2'-O)/16S rRNA (cytidine1409-2'-O)-methyltransferase